MYDKSINQSINLYRAIVHRRVLQCGYAESKRNVLRRILNVLTDGAVRQFSGREFQRLGAATEKQRRAAVSKLCGGPRNWQKLLCGWSQQAMLTVWANFYYRHFILEWCSHNRPISRVNSRRIFQKWTVWLPWWWLHYILNQSLTYLHS